MQNQAGMNPIGADAPAPNRQGDNRLVGLYSLRFVCAFLVVLDHWGFGGIAGHGTNATGWAKISIGVLNSLFNGPAAVIVFFVVSGFCIHYPFRNGRPIVVSNFYIRRFVRIVPPALAFIALTKLFHWEVTSLQDTVLWSVICELIYYVLYPALLYVKKRSSWQVMIGIAFTVAAVEIATHLTLVKSNNNGYTAVGWATWIVGLPCWLLGCWLAEHYQSFAILPSYGIWLVRIAIFVLSVVLRLAKFHISAPLGSNCILLNLFAIPICYWIGAEVSYFRKHPPSMLLESAGRWSYSLYLVHTLVPSLFVLAGMTALVQNRNAQLLMIAISLVASYLFYLAIEGPCHRLAILMARKVARP